MTSGLLLKRLHQRGLCGISHVIVDEVHERDLDNDVLLGLLRSAMVVHPALKVVLMSATIDARKFQQYLQQRLPSNDLEHVPLPPVIAVKGHSYDVKCLFLEDIVEKMGWVPPPQKKEKDKNGVAMTTSNWVGKVFHSSKHLKNNGQSWQCNGSQFVKRCNELLRSAEVFSSNCQGGAVHARAAYSTGAGARD
eukprot:symbB.v1.2.009151.t1/scaffold548.1/size229490/11